jgi:DNA polymerase/3'-5' exonuclease PolX
MDNHAVAAVLAQTASLLETRGDNPFKIRSCRPAVETITAPPETVVRLDEQALLATGGDATLMDRFPACPLVERVLGHGATKSSVRLRSGFQLDLRLVSAESRGAALQHFTGSKAHNTALGLNETMARRAIERGANLVVLSNAHAVARLHNIHLGIGVCRRAWATPGGVLNTLPLDAFRSALKRNGRNRS